MSRILPRCWLLAGTVISLPRMRTVGALLATLSCTAFAEAAHADTRDAHEPLVILTEQGSKDAENIAFFSSVRALAAEIGILVTTEEVPSFQNVRDTLVSEARVRKKPFLVAWIQREERVRTVHLFDPWNNKLRTRIIDVGDSATANAEALALILRAELVAYLHDLTPPPPPLSPPVPAPAPPPSSPEPGSRWALAAFYTLGNFLRGHGAQQGVRIAVEPMEQHFRLGIGYTLLPEETAGQEVAIIVRRHPIDLDLGYASREHHRLRWVGGTVLSGDWVTRHTSLAPSPL